MKEKNILIIIFNSYNIFPFFTYNWNYYWTRMLQFKKTNARKR